MAEDHERNDTQMKNHTNGIYDRFPSLAKKPLRFGKDGKFKILCISDIQETVSFSPVTEKAISVLLDTEKPDLVLLLGDNCNGPKIGSEEEMRRYAQKLSSFFESRDLPWAHVWGNHDHEVALNKELHQSIYTSLPGCLSFNAPGVSGQSNFVLPILGSTDDRIRFNVWGLDSGSHINTFASEILGEQRDLWEEARSVNERFRFQSVFGLLAFDRLVWYFNTSKAIEEENGFKPAALLVTHVAPWEMINVVADAEKCGSVGRTTEGYALNTFNSGLFSAILQRGDVKAVCSGHTHRNDVCGEYCGIRLCSDGSIGYSAYGDADTRGGRIYEIDEKDPYAFTTRMVHTIDLI